MVRVEEERRIPRGSPECPLSPRQLQVVEACGMGMSNSEIAELLGLAEQTVKNHLGIAMQTLNVPDRTAAVVRSLRNGYLDLDVVCKGLDLVVQSKRPNRPSV